MTTSSPLTDLIHLRSAGVSVVIDASGSTLPRIVHWGADIGDLSPATLRSVVDATIQPEVSNTTDDLLQLSLIPENSRSWTGTPGLSGHRDGADFSPAFATTSRDFAVGADGSQTLRFTAHDADAALELHLTLELTAQGLLRSQANVRNDGEGVYTLDGLLIAFPVPNKATDLLDLTGRHLRERSPQRHPFTLGTYSRENRRGRTGADATLLLIAGAANFGFRSGQVWGVHTAWSGNHRTLAERIPLGNAMLAGGELLLSGEVRLAQGETYTSPWLFGSFGDGLDELSGRFHDYLRARPQHPVYPRRVVGNTWEATYFDHDLERLTALATAAAAGGVERFVLDDGWFLGRRDDHAGLGDWYVDAAVWPEGLGPLADAVRGLGMDFGLWFEPEMVNPDSDLARAHPEWILQTGKRMPPLSRHQQVLDLAHQGAYDYILERLDSLIKEYGVAYVKWDHNRDLIDAGHSPRGQAGVSKQTRAVYRLIDELKGRNSGLEIESCASGGGRVDLEILSRTDRIWASDCVDAHERQLIQRWTGLLVPPELVGAHVGSPVNHSTGRSLTLDFRAATAFFGDMGVEWNLTTATEKEQARFAQWVSAYKSSRDLLHSGRVVRVDSPDPTVWINGVVAHDASRAIFSVAIMGTSEIAPHGRVRLAGLNPDLTYSVRPLPPGDLDWLPERTLVPWWHNGLEIPGSVLHDVGIQLPDLPPESAVILELVAVPAT